MGQGRTKKQRFKTDHPFCCFCGGHAATSTIDHVPNRASFTGRAGPEGYEFPACDACQNETRLDEIAFSCMVIFNIHDDRDIDEPRLQRLLDGLKNNLPELAKFRTMSANEKRKAMREMRIVRPAGMALNDVALLKISREFHEPVIRYLKKLARALFYKHVGRPANSTSVAWAHYAFGAAGNHQEFTDAWLEMTPIAVHATRANIDFGNRFRYRINYSDEAEAFAAVGQFSDGLIFYLLLVGEEMAERLNAQGGFLAPGQSAAV